MSPHFHITSHEVLAFAAVCLLAYVRSRRRRRSQPLAVPPPPPVVVVRAPRRSGGGAVSLAALAIAGLAVWKLDPAAVQAASAAAIRHARAVIPAPVHHAIHHHATTPAASGPAGLTWPAVFLILGVAALAIPVAFFATRRNSGTEG